MTLEPLLAAPLAVQIHVATVLPSAVIGAFLLLWRRKGTLAHRILGRIWFALMIATSVSSLFIHELNMWRGFSPIHILSLLTIVGCCYAVRAAMRGNIRAHRLAMTQIYVGGIVIAGGFTFAPYRIMNRALIEGSTPGQLVSLAALVFGPWLLFHLAQKWTGRRGTLRTIKSEGVTSGLPRIR
ncbi:putative membrane protein [Rhizobium sp. SG_E_25_P2]|uniref:DUF2306 domain-containing protein n=1 Tax=Rhizobium sp. SG_E_25_P2 TaxID=2879942 RepID=UPI002473C2DE|nr:DUF2306 domain-containing protein [Rhizobium sp. SG_E_25_P2]MDH6266928.1 putative membrane protein [Rhizobium sp. SG_E_25_P2]